MIYVIHDPAGLAIKVGVAADPAQRMRELQVGNATPLRMLLSLHGDTRSEKAIHERFKDFRLRGEWFHEEALSAAFRGDPGPVAGQLWHAWWGFGDGGMKMVVVKSPPRDWWGSPGGRNELPVRCFDPAGHRMWDHPESTIHCQAFELCFPVGFPFEVAPKGQRAKWYGDASS